MLKDPRLLILDEPANGLDPAGIREMRDLMRSLAAAGVTVLLSSHILGEVQQICDSVTIIAAGRRVAAGPVADVLAAADNNEFRVRVADLPRAAELLVAAGASVRTEADHLRLAGVTDAAWISETLGRESLWVTELTPLTPDLEHVFLELTGTMPDPGHPRQIDDPPHPGATPAIDVVEETSA
jgi:ABC-2 type transport system ATP-binding protein